MSEVVTSNGQKLNHLISSSKWDGKKLMDEIAFKFIDLIGQNNLQDDLTLLIDESGFTKKGKKSAGVKHQYNGQMGKLDNCQVGVFGALNAGSITCIVKAVLQDGTDGKTKIDIAKDIIDHVVFKLKIKPKCINADAFYGRDTDGKTYYCLTNFNAQTNLKTIAYYQSKRYFIERAFQDGKKNLGMRQYECRSATAWHRHIALCMLALLFIQHEKLLLCNTQHTYISTEDATKLFAALLELTEVRIKQIIQSIIAKSPTTKDCVRNKIYLRI